MIGARVGRDLMQRLVEAEFLPDTVRDVTIRAPLKGPITIHSEIMVEERLARILGDFFTDWAEALKLSDGKEG